MLFEYKWIDLEIEIDLRLKCIGICISGCYSKERKRINGRFEWSDDEKNQTQQIIIDTPRWFWWNAGPPMWCAFALFIRSRNGNRYGHEQRETDTAIQTHTNKKTSGLSILLFERLFTQQIKTNCSVLTRPLCLSHFGRHLIHSKANASELPIWFRYCFAAIKHILIVSSCLSKVNWIVIFAASLFVLWSMSKTRVDWRARAPASINV